MLTLDEIREIITLIDKSSIQRFELEHEATRIVIAKADSRISTDEYVRKQAEEWIVVCVTGAGQSGDQRRDWSGERPVSCWALA